MSLWTYGFRPFFIVGATWGILSILIWLLFYLWGYPIITRGNPIYWHAHEMIYGFSMAIIAGFLLTASSNWTGKKQVQGRKLLTLVGLWILARVLSLFEATYWMGVQSDLLFGLYLFSLLLPYLANKSQLRNVKFLGIILLVVLSNFAYYAAPYVEGWNQRVFIYLGLYLVVATIFVVAGRIIPFFTSKVVSNYKPKRFKYLDVGIGLGFSLVGLYDVMVIHTVLASVLALATFLLIMTQLYLWYPIGKKIPGILMILYIGYGFLGLGFALKGVQDIFSLAHNSHVHMITIGGIGVICFGMMTRVSLGHTGRVIRASRSIMIAYALICLAAFSRVFLPSRELSIFLPGLLWIIAFTIFLVSFFGVLVSPRVR